MKTFFVVALMLFATLAGAQNKEEIPAVVQESFAKQYPDVKKFKTKVLKNEVSYKFKLNKSQTTALYTKQGEWISTAKVITVEELPKVVFMNIRKTYSAATIGEVQQLIKPTGTSYKAVLNFEDHMLHVEYSKAGELLKSERKNYGPSNNGKVREMERESNSTNEIGE